MLKQIVKSGPSSAVLNQSICPCIALRPQCFSWSCNWEFGHFFDQCDVFSTRVGVYGSQGVTAIFVIDIFEQKVHKRRVVLVDANIFEKDLQEISAYLPPKFLILICKIHVLQKLHEINISLVTTESIKPLGWNLKKQSLQVAHHVQLLFFLHFSAFLYHLLYDPLENCSLTSSHEVVLISYVTDYSHAILELGFRVVNVGINEVEDPPIEAQLPWNIVKNDLRQVTDQIRSQIHLTTCYAAKHRYYFTPVFTNYLEQDIRPQKTLLKVANQDVKSRILGLGQCPRQRSVAQGSEKTQSMIQISFYKRLVLAPDLFEIELFNWRNGIVRLQDSAIESQTDLSQTLLQVLTKSELRFRCNE